jgi:hypothetical protein
MMTLDLRSLTLVERKDGFDRAQPEPYGANGSGTSYELLPPWGTFGRPRGPSDGTGANGLVLMHGSEGIVIAGTDPRYHAGLPDLGDGGAGFYATVEISGAVQTPYVAFFGKDGEKDEGTMRAEVQTAAGVTTIEVNATTGDVTIEHAAGTKVIVKSDAVYLGDESAVPLVKYTALLASWTELQGVITGLGGTLGPLASANTTKVKGT